MRVLSVVHDPLPTGGGGLFERVVVERGHALDRWVAPDEPAPSEPRGWDAIMIFGGSTHPDQDAEHPWLAAELRFVEQGLAHDVPVFGVCLGAQLIARVAGGRIGPARSSEVGWFPVELTDEGVADSVLGVLPHRVDAFQWHYYGFDVPPDGVELARSPAAKQAFRLGDRVWGIQFHAEVERHMLERWFGDGREELGAPIEEIWAQTNRLLADWNARGGALCDAFLAEAERLTRGA